MGHVRSIFSLCSLLSLNHVHTQLTTRVSSRLLCEFLFGWGQAGADRATKGHFPIGALWCGSTQSSSVLMVNSCRPGELSAFHQAVALRLGKVPHRSPLVLLTLVLTSPYPALPHLTLHGILPLNVWIFCKEVL